MNSIIQTPTNGLQNSLDFYRSLNFEVLSESAPTVVTDGKAVIEINPDRFSRAGVKLYADSWSETITELEKITKVTSTPQGHVASDPSGVWVYLVEGECPVSYQLQEKSFSALGNCAGLSLESTDMDRSIEFWGILGFALPGPYKGEAWVAAKNSDEMMVCFMAPMSCPHLFFNPSLTYFNGGNNLENIQKIKDAGIPFAEEITHFNPDGIVDNVIIRDPGGFGFFIYND